MNTRPVVGNIGEVTTAKARETRKTAKTGEARTKLGIGIHDITAESAEATMSVAGNRQPYRLPHEGTTASLAERTASVAAGARAATRGMAAVGADLTITHVRPVQFGTVRYTVQVQHLRQRTVVHVFQVVSETDGELISFGPVSYQLVAKNPDGAS